MDPSSLIFVVIVAIWVAYLLGHWVRRRDQVATARSVDRFSQAMRVLERRPVVRSVPLSRPNPRSYVVAPAQRPAPSLTVKRAAVVTRPEPAAVPTSRPTSRTESSPRPGRTARRARGLAFLALVTATPTAWLLVALTTTPVWVGVMVTLLLVAMVAELRRSARRARELARRRQVRSRRDVALSRRDSRRQVVGQVVAARGRAAAGDAALDQAAVPDESAPDVTPAADDGSWQPVPVPPPTYTLKPKAPPVRRRVDPVEPAVQSAQAWTADARTESVPAAAAPTAAFDLDEILERRIASGS